MVVIMDGTVEVVVAGVVVVEVAVGLIVQWYNIN